MAPPVCQWQAELLRPPDLPPAQLPHEDVVFIPHVSLQAILVVDSPDVDLRLWNATVAEMEASGKCYLLYVVPRELSAERAPALRKTVLPPFLLICRWVARSLAPTRMPALWN